MLGFSDKPYQYYPPKPHWLAIRFFRLFNQYFYLPGSKHRIKKVTVVNPDALKNIVNASKRHVLFLPNHPTHSDAQIVLEAQRQISIPSLFIAAYDTFERNKFHAWVMQRTGAFSVDRDGNDSQSIKQAIQALVEGNYALTIFPEGNVYLMNDRIMPFLEGAAYIGLKAQKALGTEPVYAVPVSIKATYISDQREKIIERIKFLSGIAETGLNSHDLTYSVKHIGLKILRTHLQERRYVFEDVDANNTASCLKKAAEMIIIKLENDMGLPSPSSGELIDRVRKIRRNLHTLFTRNENQTESPRASSWADEAMLALRVLSYSGNYLDENPTLDRFGETVGKIMEDLYSEAQPPYGFRHVYVYLGEPLNLSEHLSLFKNNPRETLQLLTEKFEDAVQKGLDILNRNNPHCGKELFVSSS